MNEYNGHRNSLRTFENLPKVPAVKEDDGDAVFTSND